MTKDIEKLTRHLLDWFIENYPEIENQVKNADLNYEYTGAGFFVDFIFKKKDADLKLSKFLDKNEFNLKGPFFEIDGKKMVVNLFYL